MAESGKPVAGEKIHAKDVTDELAKKADILNRDQSIAAKEIIIGKPYVSPGPSAFKNARLLKIDSEGNIWIGVAEEDFNNATPDEEIVNRAVWTRATMGDIWLGKANRADEATVATNVKTTLDTGSTTRYITFADGNTAGNKNQYINTNLKYTPSSNTIEATLNGRATTAAALGDDFGFHQRANTESSSTTATFKVTPDKAYLLFQTHSNHYGVYLISTYAKGHATILDNNDGLTGLSVNKAGNKITVTSTSGRLSLIMVGRNT